MKIALYGATGKVAQPILHEALSRGHEVTAVSRAPSRSALPSHRKLRVEQGDVLAGVSGLVKGHDVVLSAIGPPSGSDADLLVKAAHSLISGLKDASIRRLLIVGGAGTLEVAPGVRYLDTPEFPAQVRPASLAHLEAMIVYSESQLDWTVVSPGAEFGPGERTGRYRTAPGTLMRDTDGRSRISFADYAIAMIDEIENPKFLRRHMAVGY